MAISRGLVQLIPEAPKPHLAEEDRGFFD